MHKVTLNLIFFFLIFAFAAVASSSINYPPEKCAEAVLTSKDKFALQETHKIDYLSAANILFQSLPTHEESPETWDALFKIREWFDGAAHEEYGYMANELFTKHPEIFYRKYLAGDTRAIILTQEAFIPGTWVLESATLMEAEKMTIQIKSALQKSIEHLKTPRPPTYKYDERALHDAYMARTNELFEQWTIDRADLLKYLK